MNDLHPGLGTFARLPLELREMVYENLMTPAKLLVNDSDDPGAILRTSHRLFEEVSKILYNRSLVFPIFPTAFGMHPLIVIQDKNNVLACLYPDYLYFDSCHSQHSPKDLYRDGHDSVYRFLHLPYDRLHAIRFEIPAPSPSDPGELVRMWNALVWLVDLLDRTDLDHLPPVEISVTESEGRSWTTNGALHRSVAEPEWDLKRVLSDREHSDLEILLTPFCRLRRCKAISIDIPLNLRHHPIQSMIQDIERKATWTIGFGEHVVDVDSDDIDDDDDDITMLENSWTVWLDYLLHDLPGHSAAMTRVHRVNNNNAETCHDYITESCVGSWEDRHFCDDNGGGGTLLSKECVGHLVHIWLCKREDFIEAWNPGGVWAQRKLRRAGEYGKEVLKEIESSVMSFFGVPGRASKMQYAFAMYRNFGISRESSPEFKRHMEEWFDGEKDKEPDCDCFYGLNGWVYPNPCHVCGARRL